MDFTFKMLNLYRQADLQINALVVVAVVAAAVVV